MTPKFRMQNFIYGVYLFLIIMLLISTIFTNVPSNVLYFAYIQIIATIINAFICKFINFYN